MSIDWPAFWREEVQPKLSPETAYPGVTVGTRIPCPIHDGEDANFLIDAESLLWCCHSRCRKGGGPLEFANGGEKPTGKRFVDLVKTFAERVGVSTPSSLSSNGKPKWERLGVWKYLCIDGSVSFRKVKLRKPDGDTTYITERPNPAFDPARDEPRAAWLRGLTENGKPAVEIVPLALPAVAKAIRNGTTIFVCEGEKDAERLYRLGKAADLVFVTTTSHAGAGGRWKTLAAYFVGADVVLLPDNDKAGRDGASKAFRWLKSKAKRIRVLELPGLPEKGDVSDWIEQGGTAERFLALVDTATDAASWIEQTIKATPVRDDDVGGGLPVCGEQWCAELLVGKHHAAIRRIEDQGVWRVYHPDTGRWRLDRNDAEMMRRVQDTIATVARKTFDRLQENEETRDYGLAAERRWNNCSPRKRTIELASVMPQIAVESSAFDKHPEFLNTLSGVVDLTTGELKEHDPDLLLTGVVPVPFDPAAKCPRFDDFLRRIQPDAAVRRYLLRALGFSLFGDVRGEKLHLFVGSGANGKTTLINIAQSTLGEDFSDTATMTLLLEEGGRQHPEQFARLHGKRMVFADELPEGRFLNERHAKLLTGRSMITARFMHRSYFRFQPTHKLFVATNNLPRIEGTDDGIWRRVQPVPFDVQIPRDEQDRGLPKALEEERSGILNRFVQGALDFHRNGFAPPPSVKVAHADYRATEDGVGAWLAERTRDVPDAWTRTKDLAADYERWRTERAEEVDLTQSSLTRRLRQRGYVKKARSGGLQGIVGLELRSVTPLDFAELEVAL